MTAPSKFQLPSERPLALPEKKSLDDWLNGVDYSYLNTDSYLPTEFSMIFMNFIRLVNQDSSRDSFQATPAVHLKMLDKLVSGSTRILNLCWRGAAKTTLFMEYLTLFLATYGVIPNFGRVGTMIYVSDSMDNGVKSAKNNIEARYSKSQFLQSWVPHARFTENYLEFKNVSGEKLQVRMFGAKTGIRGVKMDGDRPVLAILDDLVSDDDATSQAAMTSISNTVYKGVDHALNPLRRMVIFNGTPFAKNDIIVEAVESGGWDVNVWPVCEKFPCSEEEFRGAWPERFSYQFVKEQYDFAVANGKLAAFQQELMLRLSSEEDRLVTEGEIKWYSRRTLLKYRHNFNYYITTDFATTDKQTSDYTVILVWAYNSAGDWFLVDGVCARQLMDKTVNDLFRFVQEYQPQQVGIENSGQQGAFITWLQQEQIVRNIWFNFASSNTSGSPGIRPIQNKLSRFNLVVPWFKAGKIHFPDEIRSGSLMTELLTEIRLATVNGLKGKDDVLDAISMLGFLKPWKPSQVGAPADDREKPESTGFNGSAPSWKLLDQSGSDDEEGSRLDSYIV